MTDEVLTSKVGDFVQSLISEYSPMGETFDVPLPDGNKLTFKNIGGYAELSQYKAGLKEFINILDRPSVKLAWADFLPKNNDEIVAAYTIHHLSVEPKFEMDDACRLLKAAWLVEAIMTAVESSRMAFTKKLAEKMSDEKKDSETTPTP